MTLLVLQPWMLRSFLESDSAGTETRIDYAEGDPFASFDTSDSAELVFTVGAWKC